MHAPPPPGEVLRELYLEPLGVTVTEAARRLGVTRKTLSELVNRRAGVSPRFESGAQRRALRRAGSICRCIMTCGRLGSGEKSEKWDGLTRPDPPLQNIRPTIL